MCGCGTTTWCAGNCTCGCDHADYYGQLRQAKHFALQYGDMRERATDSYQRGYERGYNDGVGDGFDDALKRAYEAVAAAIIKRGGYHSAQEFAFVAVDAIGKIYGD